MTGQAAIAASFMALLIGLLVVIPILNYANYCAYRDIFLYDDGSISV